jgi:hypothetical protein
MEKENPKVEFTTRVVKQGNSLCMRIGQDFAKHMELYEGDLVNAVIQKVDNIHMPQWMIQIYRKHFGQELKGFSDKDLHLCVHHLGILQHTLKGVTDKKKRNEVLEIQKKMVEAERGPEFLEKYNKFFDIFETKKSIRKWQSIIPEMQQVPVWGEMATEAMEKHKEWLKKNKKKALELSKPNILSSAH